MEKRDVCLKTEHKTETYDTITCFHEERIAENDWNNNAAQGHRILFFDKEPANPISTRSLLGVNPIE